MAFMTSKPYKTEDKIYQDLLLLTANDEFMKDVQAIREKCKKPPIAIPAEDGGYLYIDYNQMPEYQDDINNLRGKYHLSKLYHLSLDLFCRAEKPVPELYKVKDLWDTLLPESLPCLKGYGVLDFWSEFGEPIPFEKIIEEIESHVVIKLYPETTLKDIVNAWPEIAKKRDKLFGITVDRKVKREKLERDLFIYELYKQGKSCIEIIKALKDDERFKNEKVYYYEIAKIVARLKKSAKDIIPIKET